MSSWSQRIGKVRQYLSRGDMPGLVTEMCRYWLWKQAERRGRRSAICPPEFLLPQIRKHIMVEEIPFITANRENPDWPEEELRAKIIELGPWAYRFAFAYGLTTETFCESFCQPSIEHHRFRSKWVAESFLHKNRHLSAKKVERTFCDLLSLVSETVVDLLGNEVGQSTVLDLACHSGIYAFDMAFRGAQSVHGIELRQKSLEQAEFLKDYYRIPNVTFEQGDVYDLDQDLEAEVVLCMGILYHVVRPVDLIEFCYHHSRKFTVIDTNCSTDPVSAYYVVRDKNTESSLEGTRPIELLPTYRAIIDTMQEAGFKEIVEVVGTCDTPIFLYSDYTRRCFIGFKETGMLDAISQSDSFKVIYPDQIHLHDRSLHPIRSDNHKALWVRRRALNRRCCIKHTHRVLYPDNLRGKAYVA
jgi:hypothetical protein